jgi:hypothetical protein
MSEIEQLERSIENLSPEDLARFRTWFLEFDAQRWDRQIEGASKAGKLDALIEESMTDYKTGKSKEL